MKIDSLESTFRSHLSAKAVIWSELANWFGICEPMQGGIGWCDRQGSNGHSATALTLVTE